MIIISLFHPLPPLISSLKEKGKKKSRKRNYCIFHAKRKTKSLYDTLTWCRFLHMIEVCCSD